ncbi:MAG: trypsin-like peptidase domain-containing protein [Boseongicola sp.]|nr:trypsin-like peptidase domain-containing protein [Boseongicola sp.]
MTIFAKFIASALLMFWAGIALAQGSSWVQIEARPSAGAAQERAAFYASGLPDVQGYRLSSGWYAIALGPYSEAEAVNVLNQLRAQGRIPRDSFLANGANFRTQFFAGTPGAASVETVVTPLVAGEETEAEARASERQLTREERALVQVALRWEGVYSAAIDADFGPGTRRAMAAWQQQNGFEATGVMTTKQRQDMLTAYQDAVVALNMTPTIEANAGIEIDLPRGLVSFEEYEAPFAKYRSTTDDGVQVLLISQEGNRERLAALFEVMQTLEIVPLEGSRALRRNDFTLTGTNNKIISHTYARLDGGAIKGFSLIWPADDPKRQRLALQAMQETFLPIDGVLQDSASTGTQDIDLLSGLAIRRPERARSGFFVDSSGAVLTTASAVNQCSRVTVGEDIVMSVGAVDDALGVAYLTPQSPIAPLASARLASVEPRLQSDIAVSGFSFGGVLTLPSLTFGTFSDVKGLDGDTRVQRLDVQSEAGDAGGPVFETSGSVMGMLLDSKDSARQLPGSVAFALDASVLSEFLAANGIATPVSAAADEIAPEDLTLLAADMTVLVSCWN